jgi:hypothetical protein
LAFAAASGLSVARAAESDDPERLIKRGNDLRREGDNIRAFGYLQRAYELAGTPRTSAQLGLCEQALGRFADAEVHLTAALSTNDAWVDANRAGLEASRSLVRKRLGKVQVTGAPPGTSASLSGAAAQKLPADGALWVAPGAVNVTLQAPGFRAVTRSSSVVEGGATTLAAGMAALAGSAVAVPAVGPPPTLAHPVGAGAAGEPAAGPAHPPEQDAQAAQAATTPGGASDGDAGPGDDPGATMRITGLVVAGAGVGLVVGGLVLRHVAGTKLGAIDSDAQAVPPRPYNPANGNWKTFENSGIALLAVGGAAVVTGAALYLFNRDGDGTSAAATNQRRGPFVAASRLSFAWSPGDGPAVGFATAF